MTTAKDIRDRRNRCFVDGYISGEHGNMHSARELHALYPSLSALDVEHFLAGEDDGRRRDMWRIENMGAGDMLAATYAEKDEEGTR